MSICRSGSTTVFHLLPDMCFLETGLKQALERNGQGRLMPVAYLQRSAINRGLRRTGFGHLLPFARPTKSSFERLHAGICRIT